MGMQKEVTFSNFSILRDVDWLYDHYVNMVIYGLLAREWQS